MQTWPQNASTWRGKRQKLTTNSSSNACLVFWACTGLQSLAHCPWHGQMSLVYLVSVLSHSVAQHACKPKQVIAKLSQASAMQHVTDNTL